MGTDPSIAHRLLIVRETARFFVDRFRPVRNNVLS
jgi:hypothetical protein